MNERMKKEIKEAIAEMKRLDGRAFANNDEWAQWIKEQYGYDPADKYSVCRDVDDDYYFYYMRFLMKFFGEIVDCDLSDPSLDREVEYRYADGTRVYVRPREDSSGYTLSYVYPDGGTDEEYITADVESILYLLED